MKYTRTHEWVKPQDKEAVVGITDHAQHELGDIVYVELPKVGHQVKAGEASAVLESTKAAADFYSPVSGKIVAVNEQLRNDSGLINRAPETEGWIYKIALSEEAELNSLLDHQAYREMTK